MTESTHASGARSSRRGFLKVAGITTAAIAVPTGKAAASTAPVRHGLAGAYTDPAYLTDIPFGSHSHWLQPWRAYIQTIPASTYIDGVAINFNVDPGQALLTAEMLARHGVTNARVEIGWGNISYDDETQLSDPSRFRTILAALGQWKIRPLILLNAHQGAPCPVLFFSRTVTADAAAGDRRVVLEDTTGLVLGRSGMSQLTDYWAAEAIITDISGNTVTLSKPLPNAISAGTSVPMATLKYRPFSPPDTTDYTDTIAGWQRYVATIASFTADALGTTSAPDKGFDLEVWNELTFGSEFLSINNYYDPPLYSYDENAIWHNLVAATADGVASSPTLFSKVQIGDGFANTIPWPASSTEPARIHAIDKHPYSGRKNYPADEYHGTAVNALGKPDSYIPTYSVLFPEYYGTAIQTETMVRDMGPITNDIYGLDHGAAARPGNPCPVWITEVNLAPDENGITDRAAALALKAKTTARYLAFFLNKGVTKLHFFAASGGDTGLGMVLDTFLDYAGSHTTYPHPDKLYTSPALRVIQRMSARLGDGLDRSLTYTRTISIDSITDTHDHYQFSGDGTPAHPPLYDREVLAILPYQVNASRFVIAYYVMTRDVTITPKPEDFTVTLSGLKGTGAEIDVYDPINDRAVPFSVDHQTTTTIQLTLAATDYPCLITVQEHGRAAVVGSNA